MRAPYQTQGGGKARDEKRWKIFKDSSAPGFTHKKKCSNYTLFRVLRHNLHVKCCNRSPFYFLFFTTVTLRPLKKKKKKKEKRKGGTSRFPFNESHLAPEFSCVLFSFFFFLRLKLHRDVAVQILPLCSFSVGLCLVVALLAQGGSFFLFGGVAFRGQSLHVSIFLSRQQ